MLSDVGHERAHDSERSHRLRRLRCVVVIPVRVGNEDRTTTVTKASDIRVRRCTPEADHVVPLRLIGIVSATDFDNQPRRPTPPARRPANRRFPECIGGAICLTSVGNQRCSRFIGAPEVYWRTRNLTDPP